MSTHAENPGKVKFSYKKYYSFRNRINTKFSGRFYSDMQIENVMKVLLYGDTQPALVRGVWGPGCWGGSRPGCQE